MALTKEEQAKIAAIKRAAAEKKRQEQIKAFRRKQEKPAAKKPVFRRFTAKDFFLFRYMATPEIVAGLFIIYLVAFFVALAAGASVWHYPWYYRVGIGVVGVLVMRLLFELAVVPFSINNHLAEISEKLDKLHESRREEE
jgi:sterol desaturase/sphingolipid hydroxylase (fatty acid hydroxylase superfamily)